MSEEGVEIPVHLKGLDAAEKGVEKLKKSVHKMTAAAKEARAEVQKSINELERAKGPGWGTKSDTMGEDMAVSMASAIGKSAFSTALQTGSASRAGRAARNTALDLATGGTKTALKALLAPVPGGAALADMIIAPFIDGARAKMDEAYRATEVPDDATEAQVQEAAYQRGKHGLTTPISEESIQRAYDFLGTKNRNDYMVQFRAQKLREKYAVGSVNLFDRISNMVSTDEPGVNDARKARGFRVNVQARR